MKNGKKYSKKKTKSNANNKKKNVDNEGTERRKKRNKKEKKIRGKTSVYLILVENMALCPTIYDWINDINS